MSEKMLALLFRLYPAAFRQRYLREALLLCRDRRRHGTSIYRRARLVCDLFVDFFAGLPKAWQTSYSIVAVRSQVPNTQPVPCFSLLDSEPLRPASILLGCMFFIMAFGVFVLILRTTALYPLERRTLSPIESVIQRLNQPALPALQKVDPQKASGDITAFLGTQQPVESDETAPTSAGGAQYFTTGPSGAGQCVEGAPGKHCSKQRTHRPHIPGQILDQRSGSCPGNLWPDSFRSTRSRESCGD
jgi:hypothetical protein